MKESNSTRTVTMSGIARVLAALAVCVAGSWLWAPAVFAAGEICASCEHEVSVTGDFTHRKEDTSLGVQGAASNAAAFREEINGKDFSVSVANLPEGRYTIQINHESDSSLVDATVTADHVSTVEVE